MEKKRSLKYLLVSVCLALLVASIGGILAGANATINVNNDLEIKGATLDLNNKLGIAFAVEAGTWNENMQLQVFYKHNPADTAVAPVNDVNSELDGEIITELHTEQVSKDDVTYDVVIMEGLAAKDLANPVYVRLHDTEANTYSPVLRTGVLELVYLMQEQEMAKEAADRNSDKLNLYSSIIAYADAARNHLLGVDVDHAIVRVEDGYALDDHGYQVKCGLFEIGEKLTMAADDELVNAASSKYNTYVNETTYSVLGWSSTADLAIDDTTATSVVVKGAATYSPVLTPDSYKINEQSAVVYASKTSGGNAAATAWSSLTAGTYYSPNYSASTAEGATATLTHPAFTYDADKDAIVLGNSDKTSSQQNFAHLNFTNPQYKAASMDNSVVLEFNVMIPSIDNNGDGIYNQVGKDIVYNGANGTTGIFNIVVGFEGANYVPNFGSERLFMLNFTTATSGTSNTVNRWALNSQADGGFSSAGRVFNSVTTYAFDTEHNIKLVFSPQEVVCYKADLTTVSAVTIDRVDIYVDNVLHHSRVMVTGEYDSATGKIINYANSGSTDTYSDVQLGFYNTIQQNLLKNSSSTSNDYFGGHFNSRPRYVLSAYTPNGQTTVKMELSNASAYCTPVSEFTDGRYIDTAGIQDGVAVANPYDHTNTALHGIPMLYKDRYTVAELNAANLIYGVVENSATTTYVSTYRTSGALQSNIAWNNLNGYTDIPGRLTAMSTTGANTKWSYDATRDLVSVVTKDGSYAQGGRVAFGAANPFVTKGINTENYSGEKLVFEFTINLPTQDTNGDGVNNSYSDFIYHDGTYWHADGSATVTSNKNTSVYDSLGFGFRELTDTSFDVTGYKVFDFRMRTQTNTSGVSDPKTVMNKWSIETSLASAGLVTATYNPVNTGYHVVIVITPDANGNVVSADIWMNDKYDYREMGGSTDADNLLSTFTGNVFTNTACGISLINGVGRIGTIEVSDVNCYLINK